jgi:DNA-binding Lrp family transcriptional regulator
MTAEPSLDRIDRSILRVLQADGRITNHALAARVHLSPSACLARVRRLERTGIILGYHARLDPFRVGIGLVLIVEVSLESNRPADVTRFEEAILAMPQVVEISDVSGDIDYVLKVVVADMPEWTRLAAELTGGGLGVHRVTTLVLMRKPRIFEGYPVPDR